MRGLFTPDFTPDSPVVFSPQCYLELAVGLLFLDAPNSPTCGTGQSGVPPGHTGLSGVPRTDSPPSNTSFVSWTSLDLRNVFF